jgi:DNA-binding LacI/PurR family transcriptional regulator
MSTQKSIADKLGISISLVSRVLSGKAREIGVAEETIEKVLFEAQRINYTPNSAALFLRGAKTHTLGVITYDFEDPYFGIILGELHKIAKQRKFSLILAGSYQRDMDTLDLSAFSKHSVEGLIIVGSDRKKDWYEEFGQKNIPVVQIGFTNDNIGTNICLDESHSTELVTNYLHKQKIKSVALFFNQSLSHETFKEHYVKALNKVKINIQDDITCDDTINSVKAGVKLLKKLPDVIIAGDDIMATKVIRALHEINIQVPKDIKVVGFDNISLAGDFVPSLTTLNPPIKEMVATAFDLVSSQKSRKKTYKFEPELICRESA